MRVITGTARGRKLKELPGLATRPTTDRVKESIFNIVQFDIEGRRVLDLFAGTGQLGIEALSRGAREAVFIDQRNEAVKVIKENLQLTHLSDFGRVICGDAVSYLTHCGEKFDLIFLDPPYESALLESSLKNIAKFDNLNPGGIIVCERKAAAEAYLLQPPYLHRKDYKYGSTVISVYGRE